MNGRDDALAAVGQKDGGAVGDPDDERRRWIVADDGISFGARPLGRARGIGSDNSDTVYLPQQQEVIDRDTSERRYRVPFICTLPKFERTVGKEMLGDGCERLATKHAAPRRLHPFESTARLGVSHGHHRPGI